MLVARSPKQQNKTHSREKSETLGDEKLGFPGDMYVRFY